MYFWVQNERLLVKCKDLKMCPDINLVTIMLDMAI